MKLRSVCCVSWRMTGNAIALFCLCCLTKRFFHLQNPKTLYCLSSFPPVFLLRQLSKAYFTLGSRVPLEMLMFRIHLLIKRFSLTVTYFSLVLFHLVYFSVSNNEKDILPFGYICLLHFCERSFFPYFMFNSIKNEVDHLRAVFLLPTYQC